MWQEDGDGRKGCKTKTGVIMKGRGSESKLGPTKKGSGALWVGPKITVGGTCLLLPGLSLTTWTKP